MSTHMNPSDNTSGAGSAGAIELDGVAQRYVTDSGDIVHALATTDLRIEPGEFVSVVGPSGCGKTTLLQMLAGFLTPTEGQVRVGGAVVQAPARERGVVFQQANLYPWMTVRANVELGPKLAGVDKADRRATAEHYLEMVGLEAFAERKPYELSGGMQQRCQIARVLATDPEVILMDEPFGALDALTRERMQDELLAIWRAKRKTVFFITHSVDEAVFLGTRVLVMSARPGRIIHDVSVDIASTYGQEMGTELRNTPEFAHLRQRIGEAVYEAQGVSSARIALH